MHQFRTEDLQPPAQFLDLGLEFALDFRGLSGLVADVQVHGSLGDGKVSPMVPAGFSALLKFTPT
jgi:hypothetical protein